MYVASCSPEVLEALPIAGCCGTDSHQWRIVAFSCNGGRHRVHREGVSRSSGFLVLGPGPCSRRGRGIGSRMKLRLCACRHRCATTDGHGHGLIPDQALCPDAKLLVMRRGNREGFHRSSCGNIFVTYEMTASRRSTDDCRGLVHCVVIDGCLLLRGRVMRRPVRRTRTRI